MVKSLISLLFLVAYYATTLSAQCLTEYNKFIPNTHVSLNNSFGYTIARFGDYIAVADPWHDTLMVSGGAVFIYKLETDNWRLVATILPSDPEERSLFGTSLALTENYLFVGAQGKSHVYVYAKNAEWQNKPEEHKITSPEASNSFGGVIIVRSDEDKLLVSDTDYRDGIVYCYSKPAAGWTAEVTPYQQLEPPPDGGVQSQKFGKAIGFEDDLLAIGAPNYFSGVGRVYLYQDMSGGSWSDFQLQANLDSSYPQGYSPEFGTLVQLMHGNIFVKAQSSSKHAIFHFRPKSNWVDTKADTVYYLTDSLGREHTTSLVAHDSTLLLLSDSENDSITAHSFLLTPDNILEKKAERAIYPTSDLVYFPSTVQVGPYGNLSMGFKQAPSGGDDGAFWVIPKEGNDWNFGKHVEQQYTYYTASEDFFGAKLLKIDDHLLVGAPNDRRTGKGYGSVQIFRKTSGKWKKLHELLADSTDINFGSSLNLQNDSLYIGSGKSINIYLKGSSWSDWTLARKIYAPDSLFDLIGGFGTHVSVSESVLATMASVQGPTSMGIRNTLFIYEKGENGWEYKQYIIFRAIKKQQDARANPIDVFEETILVEDYEAYIVEKDNAGNWAVQAKLSDINRSYIERSAHSVILTDSLAFVGAAHADRDFTNSGSVYIFKRNGEKWVDNYEPIIVQPLEKTEDMLFGSSIQLFENKLAVSALRNTYYEGLTGYIDNSSESPSSVYIFENLNNDWSQYRERGQVFGDTSQVDNMYGTSLIFDQEGLLVGAPYDSNVSGSKSGAVYHTPITVFPNTTVDSTKASYCTLDTLIHLKAAVPGGTWSGPGIIDAELGTFNPFVAGIGFHELSYKGLPCTYRKHITVEVTPAFSTAYQHETVYQLCQKDTVTLSVATTDSVSYRWFYIPEGKSDIQVLNDDKAQIDVSNGGKYWAKVYNSCQQQQLDTIYISVSQPPTIRVPDHKFACPPFPSIYIEKFIADYNYQLLQQQEDGSFQPIQTLEKQEIPIESAGVYQVRTSVGVCEWMSPSFTIKREVTSQTILPEESSIVVCAGSGEKWLEAPQEDAFKYTWHYYKEKNSQPIVVGHTFRVKAKETGYYTVNIAYAQCEWTSEKKQIIFQEPIRIGKISNVFTPNDDGVNDTFTVMVDNYTSYNLSIYNRQGKMVFYSDESTNAWDGGDFPSGVYLWTLQYQSPCAEESSTKKGYVSLMRGI